MKTLCKRIFPGNFATVNQNNKKMKKLFCFLSAAVLCAAVSVSCKKQQVPVVSPLYGQTAKAVISLSGVDAEISSRASSTSSYGGDKTASTTQILIYDISGALVASPTPGDTITLSKGMSYSVRAIVNGPDYSGLTIGQAIPMEIRLADYPWVMEGEAGLNFNSSDFVNLNVQVRSHAARIHLKSIVNNLPPAFGAITVDRVYLCNAMGGCDMSGDPTFRWLNKYGRKDFSVPVTPNSTTGAVDGSVEAAASTFKDFANHSISHGSAYNPSDAYFYSFPNEETGDIPANAATSTSWTEQATWLTICGRVQANTYYWTVNLGANIEYGLKNNTSYDVSVTINNLGSDNPGTEVTPGSAAIGVTVLPWISGTEITQTL